MSDTPFKRQLFTDMTIAQQDAFLAGVRERRLASLRKFEAATRAKKLARTEAQKAQIDKLCERFNKQMDAVDKAFAKLEKIALDIQITTQVMEQEADGTVGSED